MVLMLGRALLTFTRSLLIVWVFLFGVPAAMLYVWFRLEPRCYDGALAPRLGLLVSRGALDVLEGRSSAA